LSPFETFWLGPGDYPRLTSPPGRPVFSEQVSKTPLDSSLEPPCEYHDSTKPPPPGRNAFPFPIGLTWPPISPSEGGARKERLFFRKPAPRSGREAKRYGIGSPVSTKDNEVSPSSGSWVFPKILRLQCRFPFFSQEVLFDSLWTLPKPPLLPEFSGKMELSSSGPFH